MVRPTSSLVPLTATVSQFLLLAHPRTEVNIHIKTQYQISSCTYLFIYLFMYLFIYLFIYVFIYLFIYLFIYSFLCNGPLNYLLT